MDEGEQGKGLLSQLHLQGSGSEHIQQHRIVKILLQILPSVRPIKIESRGDLDLRIQQAEGLRGRFPHLIRKTLQSHTLGRKIGRQCLCKIVITLHECKISLTNLYSVESLVQS